MSPFFCLRLLFPGMCRYVRISRGDISLREIIVAPLPMRQDLRGLIYVMM